MSSTTFILYGFASIPRLLTIKPKNFSTEIQKAHLVGFNFILELFRNWNTSARWVVWSSALTNFTNMSSLHTSIDASICLWNILFTNLW